MSGMATLITRRQALLLAPAAVLATGLAGTALYAFTQRDTAGLFTLQDGDGHTVTDSQFRGRWMLVYFGYTHCPDACPTALQDMATALDALGPQKHAVAALFITIDPERDTQSVMKDYAAAFSPDITGLTGSLDAVAAAAHAYRVYYARHDAANGAYLMDHSGFIYLVDPKGQLAGTFTPESTPAQIAAKLRSVV